MSNRVHHAAIGGFVLGMTLLLIAVTVFFSGRSWFTDRDYFVMFFDGSVNGLRVGAPVAFKGVKVGEVTEVGIEIDTDTLQVVTPVTVAIEPEAIALTGSGTDESYRGALIERGLRAQLKIQSLLTGLLYVQLDFFPDSSIVYKNVETRHPQFPTVPTDFAELSQMLESIPVEEIAARVESAIRGFDILVNDPELRSLAGNLNRRMEAVVDTAQSVSAQVERLSPALERVLADGSGTLTTIDSELPQLSARLQQSLDRFDQSMNAWDKTLDQFAYLLSEDSMPLNRAVLAIDELGRAARAVRVLAETLDAEPEALLKGKGREERNSE